MKRKRLSRCRSEYNRLNSRVRRFLVPTGIAIGGFSLPVLVDGLIPQLDKRIRLKELIVRRKHTSNFLAIAPEFLDASNLKSRAFQFSDRAQRTFAGRQPIAIKLLER